MTNQIDQPDSESMTARSPESFRADEDGHAPLALATSKECFGGPGVDTRRHIERQLDSLLGASASDRRRPGSKSTIQKRFRPSSGLFSGTCVSSIDALVRNVKPSPWEKEKRLMVERKGTALKAIAAGGLIAGGLDLTQALILFGRRVPLSIAAGLLGRAAFRGGVGTYALGVFLHFFIAFSAAAVYYSASRKLTFLTDHPLVCGLFFGGAVEEAMNLVVLPLSALHARGPYELQDLILGLLVHMVTVGLPISYGVRRFGTR